MRRVVARIAKRVRRGGVPKHLAPVLSVEGQILDREICQLAVLAGDVPADQAIVEVGSFRGRSAGALALGSREGHGSRVYCIDPHVEFTGLRGGCYGPPDQAALYSNLTRLGIGEVVSVISLPSAQAAKAWPAQSVGLLWIDGDHRYDAVLEDFTAWYPYVVPGGVIAMHDVDLDDVRRVVDWALRERMLEALDRVETMAWFRKL
jgi:predicted O-methyltransferase YrrM